MPSFFIEMPTTPLSRHNNNTTRSARPSLSRTEIEAPTKSAPKSKNVADTQNIKPDPNASNSVVKRKRSASDMVSVGVLNAKKPRGSGLEKSGDKVSPDRSWMLDYHGPQLIFRSNVPRPLHVRPSILKLAMSFNHQSGYQFQVLFPTMRSWKGCK
ncbi:hypothetical protein FRC12_021356 [Ceratobasidium sp. 428]|nr:hypothetical protein FRC12_021356 [Ceratobasidium sp. 428]